MGPVSPKNTRRAHLEEKPYSPIGLDLERVSQPPKTYPKVPVEWSPERPIFRVSLGAGSALGPAL